MLQSGSGHLRIACFNSVEVIMSVSHAEGPGYDSQRNQPTSEQHSLTPFDGLSCPQF